MPPSAQLPRRLFDLGDPRAGPTLVAVGGIHGDEPAGVDALKRFGAALDPPASGRLLGLVGNLAALGAGTRFLDVDLNRGWTPHGIAQASQSTSKAAEHRELVQLFQILKHAWRERSLAHPFVVLDLHTTSGDGPPFAMLSTREDELAFGRGLPIIKVLGIEQYVEGALLSHLSGWGAISMGFEAGRHDAPESVANHRALLTVAAAQLGLVDRAQEEPAAERLQQASQGLPGEIRVVHRHPVRPGDGFRMRPGHHHLEPIVAGQPLADDAFGPIRAPSDGFLLMPSYGPKGEDGFFVGRAEARSMDRSQPA